MDEPSASDSSTPPSKPAAPILSYAPPNSGGMVKVARYGSGDEAQVHAAELAAQGIPAQVLNSNVNALGFFYTGFTDVELHVRAQDAQRAVDILTSTTSEDLEPAEHPDDAPPPVDEQGQPISSSRRLRQCPPDA